MDFQELRPEEWKAGPGNAAKTPEAYLPILFCFKGPKPRSPSDAEEPQSLKPSDI